MQSRLASVVSFIYLLAFVIAKLKICIGHSIVRYYLSWYSIGHIIVLWYLGGSTIRILGISTNQHYYRGKGGCLL